MLQRDAIFTNVALTADGQPWWEGLDERVPATDWQGRPYDPANGPAAHPNSRFTVSRAAVPELTAGGGEPAGRAALGDRLRRPPRDRWCRW